MPERSNGDLFSGIMLTSLILILLGAVLGISGLSYQLYFYLKNGVWEALPLTIFLNKANIDLTSIYFPNDWVGLAKTIQWLIELQAGLSFLLPGLALFFLSYILIVIFDN